VTVQANGKDMKVIMRWIWKMLVHMLAECFSIMTKLRSSSLLGRSSMSQERSNTTQSTPSSKASVIRVEGSGKVATRFSTGWDVVTAEDTRITPGGTVVIRTDARLVFEGDEWPEIDVQLRPRSSTMLKYGVMVMLGTIDCDYKETVGVVAYNTGHRSVIIPKGTRIAQIVACRAVRLDGMVVEEADRVGGFGSSGEK
jgi:dUTP pyrophosphatase